MNLVALGQWLAKTVHDPRNIQPGEWPLISHIYNAADADEWEEIKAVAKTYSKNVVNGPGENSRAAKRASRNIHSVMKRQNQWYKPAEVK
ncbi:hypothetical protein ACFVYJ_01425 [Pontibacter sp. JAM-7]|uniref:hypothetical protein n=1 Tax=Pontibacter sp. JAM-7 TaxID=3366581 RepID=UPI003AF9F6A0